MMTSFSPAVQRMVALGLLALALLLVLELGRGAIGGAGEALARLDDARHRAARLEAVRARPAATEVAEPPAGLAFAAPDHEQASALAAEAVHAAALQAELPAPSISAMPADSANPRLIRLSLAAEGPELAMLRFIAAVEGGSPAIRLRGWRLTRGDGEAPLLRLEANALAAWESAS